MTITSIGTLNTPGTNTSARPVMQPARRSNSYQSGHHATHVVDQSFACTVCHDTTKLAVDHFIHIDTQTMEGPASGIIVTAAQYNGTSCNPSSGGLTGCHGSHTW